MGSPAAHLGRVGGTRGLSHFRAAKMGLSPSGRVTPYDVVRTVLALILLTAAALKGHQLATEPLGERGLLTSRWFLIGVIELELLFGLWLFCGLYARRTWQAAVTCFSAFACVSLYKAISGETTCGCFGRVPVNPWYTLMLDAAVVLTLSCCRPARRQVSVAGGVTFRRRRAAGIVAVCVIVGIPAAVGMGSYRAAGLDDAGNIFGDSQFVVLEPETWVGKRFPLLKYIDIGDQLAQGSWVVVLYHHDCPRCGEAVPEYQRLASARMTRPGGAQVALVEMPPYSDPDERGGDNRSCARGRLHDLKQWFVRAPVQIVLAQGVLVGVSVGEDGVVPRVNGRQFLCSGDGLTAPGGGRQSD